MNYVSNNRTRQTEKFVAASSWLKVDKHFSDPESVCFLAVQPSSSWDNYLPDSGSQALGAQVLGLVGVHFRPVTGQAHVQQEEDNWEKINRIRRVLGLSMSDLAKVLGVSRKSVYNYRDGAVSSMAKQPQERLTSLSIAVNHFMNAHEEGFRVPARALNIKIDISQPTILDRLCESNTLEEFKQSLGHLEKVISGLDVSGTAKKTKATEARSGTRGSYFGTE